MRTEATGRWLRYTKNIDKLLYCLVLYFIVLYCINSQISFNEIVELCSTRNKKEELYEKKQQLRHETRVGATCALAEAGPCAFVHGNIALKMSISCNLSGDDMNAIDSFAATTIPHSPKWNSEFCAIYV